MTVRLSLFNWLHLQILKNSKLLFGHHRAKPSQNPWFNKVANKAICRVLSIYQLKYDINELLGQTVNIIHDEWVISNLFRISWSHRSSHHELDQRYPPMNRSFSYHECNNCIFKFVNIRYGCLNQTGKILLSQ